MERPTNDRLVLYALIGVGAALALSTLLNRSGAASLLIYAFTLIMYLLTLRLPTELAGRVVLAILTAGALIAVYQIAGALWHQAGLPFDKIKTINRAPLYTLAPHSIFFNPNLTGLMMATGLLLAISRRVWGLAGLFVGVLVFTGARSVWLALFVVMLVYSYRAGWLRQGFGPVLVLWGVAIAAMVFLTLALNHRTLLSVFSNRLAIWGMAWHDFQRAIWIGQGPGTFIDHNLMLPGLITHTHSLFLQSLAETGLLGGLAVGALCAAVMLTAYTQDRAQLALVVLVSGIVDYWFWAPGIAALCLMAWHVMGARPPFVLLDLKWKYFAVLAVWGGALWLLAAPQSYEWTLLLGIALAALIAGLFIKERQPMDHHLIIESARMMCSLSKEHTFDYWHHHWREAERQLMAWGYRWNDKKRRWLKLEGEAA